MKTVGELRAEIQHLQRLAAGVTDPQVREAIATLIEELERRIAELEDGAS